MRTLAEARKKTNMFEEKNGSFGSDVVMFCLSIKKLMIFQVQKTLRFFVSGTNWRSYKKKCKDAPDLCCCFDLYLDVGEGE